ncbi:MAG: acyl-CoA/acyl-ACP dehydrogenase [Chloroflexi bacterium]|nr:acyl-CoA/acyl-ACP dehydrogenase [Chloroflexota bacterium]
MDFEFSPDALMLRDMLRRFVEDEAKPMEMKFFSTRALEDNERARLRTVIEQMGLWGITVPEKFGGGGLDLVTACLLHEELGKTFLPIDLGDVPPMLYACQGDQIEKFLKPTLAGKRHPYLAACEPNAFKPEDWKTTATPQDQVYVLDGKKTLFAVPSAQDFLIVLAKAPAGIGAFIVEPNQGGVRIVENGGVTLHLEGCQAEAKSLLGECGQALRLGSDEAPGSCIQLGARYIGLAQRLLDMSIEYAKSWTALGALLMERRAIQNMLAEMQVQIESARWLVYHAAWLADKEGPSYLAAAEVRLSTGEMLRRVTDLATLVYGGPGPSQEFDINRYLCSTVPPQALELGLECARTTIAASLLAVSEGG